MAVTDVRARTPIDAASLLRVCLTALSALCVLATATELAMLRHWDSTVQLIPWFALGILVVAIALFWVRRTRTTIRVVRGLLALVAIASIVGIYEHLHENFIAGPLDYRYTDRWDQMSRWSQWWAAFSKTVGPAPTLAGGVLLQAALLLYAATLRHPALYRAEPQSTDNLRLGSAPVSMGDAPLRSKQ